MWRRNGFGMLFEVVFIVLDIYWEGRGLYDWSRVIRKLKVYDWVVLYVK